MDLRLLSRRAARYGPLMLRLRSGATVSTDLRAFRMWLIDAYELIAWHTRRLFRHVFTPWVDQRPTFDWPYDRIVFPRPYLTGEEAIMNMIESKLRLAYGTMCELLTRSMDPAEIKPVFTDQVQGPCAGGCGRMVTAPSRQMSASAVMCLSCVRERYPA